MTTPGPDTSVPGASHGQPEVLDGRDGPLLYTPAQAAERLTIKESWLRRKAGLRQIPCTFLGKHLRFSDADLRAIVNRGSTTQPRRPRRHSRRR
jgi:excisionase family DNA binding protein